MDYLDSILRSKNDLGKNAKKYDVTSYGSYRGAFRADFIHSPSQQSTSASLTRVHLHLFNRNAFFNSLLQHFRISDESSVMPKMLYGKYRFRIFRHKRFPIFNSNSTKKCLRLSIPQIISHSLLLKIFYIFAVKVCMYMKIYCINFPY